MSLMDHLASGAHALSASGARRSRRFNARDKGGLVIACAMASWMINRAKTRGSTLDRLSLNE